MPRWIDTIYGYIGMYITVPTARTIDTMIRLDGDRPHRANSLTLSPSGSPGELSKRLNARQEHMAARSHSAHATEAKSRRTGTSRRLRGLCEQLHIAASPTSGSGAQSDGQGNFWLDPSSADAVRGCTRGSHLIPMRLRVAPTDYDCVEVALVWT